MDGGLWHCTGDRDQGHPQEKETQKAKWLSKEALQIAVKRRELKNIGEKERYTHLNAEFQIIARRDKKAFLSDQCKEIQENNRMGKTRALVKKIRDTKGTFHAKMGSIKDRNGMDLTEAEDIKKRWQEYTEELYKKDLHDPDNHSGVITHLEPDILECEVKWALGSITMNKASGGDGIPVELFQILKDDAVKVLHSICQQIWKTQQWPQDWKRSIFTPIPKKGNAKECSNYHTIELISHTSKVMLKILQARLQQYVNCELPDVQTGFRKGRGTRDQIADICWIIKKARDFWRNIYFCFIDYAKAFDCVHYNKLWKILKEMGIPDHLTWLLRNVYAGQEATVELEVEQQTGSKSGKEYVKAMYCHHGYLTYMQRTSWEMLDWMKHKLESRLPGEIPITSDMQMTLPLWQKAKKN